MTKVLRYTMLAVASGFLILAIARFAYTPPPMRVIPFAHIVDRVGYHVGQMPLSKEDKEVLAGDTELIKAAHDTHLERVRLERDIYAFIGGILALLVLIHAVIERRRPIQLPETTRGK
jgi:hypothetical protein